MLDGKNMRFKYGLDAPISLSIQPGERVALLGPNGAGKSTLIKGLVGRTSLIDGHITVSGRPLQSMPRRILARALGVLHQQESQVKGFTVRQLVALGRYAYLGPLGNLNSEDHERVDLSMHLMGLSALKHRQIQTLSGGEFQRARIARLLAQEAQILVLDEPTAHLDLGHTHDLIRELVALSRTQGLGVLAAIHDLNVAAQYFDRVILLNSGRVVADGPVAHVLTKSRLEEVFQTPLHQIEHPESGRPQFLAVSSTREVS